VLNDWQIRSNSAEGGPDIGNIKAASRVTHIQLCVRCSLVHIHPLRYQDRQLELGEQKAEASQGYCTENLRFWAPDGWATFQYGEEVRPGESHIDQVPNFLQFPPKRNLAHRFMRVTCVRETLRGEHVEVLDRRAVEVLVGGRV
jgi:hypothetical protein